MLPHILASSVLNRQLQVLEVLVAWRVRLARHIQNVGDALSDQLLGLESGLVRSHVDATMDGHERDVVECLGRLTRNGALVQVGEPSTNETVLLTVVVVAGIVTLVTPHLLVGGGATWLVSHADRFFSHLYHYFYVLFKLLK